MVAKLSSLIKDGTFMVMGIGFQKFHGKVPSILMIGLI